jgi:hypothetical protein
MASKRIAEEVVTGEEEAINNGYSRPKRSRRDKGNYVFY